MNGVSRFVALVLVACFVVSAHADPASDLEAARALFERNLKAIEDRDAEAYLACYRDDGGLVRTGFGGAETEFDSWAAGVRADDTWPDSFEAFELEVFAVADGVVYGKYRYRVSYGEDVQEGISERVFVRTDDGWRIAVSTAFGAPDGALAPLQDEDR